MASIRVVSCSSVFEKNSSNSRGSASGSWKKWLKDSQRERMFVMRILRLGKGEKLDEMWDEAGQSKKMCLWDRGWEHRGHGFPQ